MLKVKEKYKYLGIQEETIKQIELMGKFKKKSQNEMNLIKEINTWVVSLAR